MNLPTKVKNKIKTCQALKGKTVFEVIRTQEYQDNLTAYLKCQREDRASIQSSYDAMKKLGGAKGYKLPAHVIDHFKDWEAKEFGLEYMRILQQRSGCSADERTYIIQICQQAYNKTVADFVVAEFPQLKKYLYPKAN